LRVGLRSKRTALRAPLGWGGRLTSCPGEVSKPEIGSVLINCWLCHTEIPRTRFGVPEEFEGQRKLPVKPLFLPKSFPLSSWGASGRRV